jgi:UDP:flavonoid glycosyltransferase YjiC (YdhE family)
MTTFLLATSGTHGDVLPFVELGRALVGRGHDVTLYTHEFYAETARRAGVPMVPADTRDEYDRQTADSHNFLREVVSDIDQIVGFFRRHGLFDQIRLEYKRMAAIIRDRPPGDVVVVGRHTSGLAPLMLRETFGVPVAWVGLAPHQYMATSLSERIFPLTLGGLIDQLRAGFGLPPVADWGSWLRSPDVHIGLWPSWFDEAGEPAPAGVALTGFVLNDEAESGELPAEVEALLDPDRPPVLITGGSGQLIHGDWYRVAVEACAVVGRPAILVCRHRELLPAELPPGVHWFPALPFATLMPRVAAVVQHGGVLTGARAVASGTPQLVLAHGIDRPDNAARMRRVGVAEWLPAARWDPVDAAALLRRLLDDPGYRLRLRSLAKAVDARAGVAAACDELEALAARGVRDEAGSESERPSTEDGHSGEIGERVRRLDPRRRKALQAMLAERRAGAGR